MRRLMSFGWAYGGGIDPEDFYVVDVRQIPNVNFLTPRLRKSHVLSNPFAQSVISLADLVPNVAVGCSFGKHRSVIIVEEIARQLRAKGEEVEVIHRDRDK